MVGGHRKQDRQVVRPALPVRARGLRQGVGQVVADLDESAEQPAEPLELAGRRRRKSTTVAIDQPLALAIFLY